MTDPLIAGVELGGTKIVCLLAQGPEAILDEVRLPTTTPAETLGAIEAVLDGWRGFAAIGVASFGPLDIDRASPGWGSITVTTKPGWSQTDIARRLIARYAVPLGFHTDVVGAALAEAEWGAARGLADLAYVTVGTGVGAGLVAAGRPLDGLSHAELGHLRPPRLAGDDFPGACRFHGACVEGLASGPAIAARAGRPATELAPGDPSWAMAADALAQLAQALTLTGVPRRIVWGGGVMDQPALLPLVRKRLGESLGGYLSLTALDDLESYLVPAALGGRAGPLGAVLLGRLALVEATRA
ncbi:MAG: ROK family protein [Sphingomonas sp.]|uniref:ROK family protein n=1 Tax=Sphingomonas sp. TaxID=28214 RepID=UPI0025DDFF11|nr:ROK family protein [Sphingomonas sp.]MBX9882161.1 ROK family protein [Sphingomonas sp.]